MSLEYRQFAVLQLPYLSPAHYLIMLQIYCVVMISNYSTTVSGLKEVPAHSRGIEKPGFQSPCHISTIQTSLSVNRKIIPCQVPIWRLLSCDQATREDRKSY